ncbi:Acg family FMN-binding oxidoreductase [Flindersiella endophytica]
MILQLHGEELEATLLRAAISAPSMHNTQPWLFHVQGSEVEVYRDLSRELPIEDPEGRAVLISHGAVCLNLRVAAAYAGYGVSVRTFPDSTLPTLVARLSLEQALTEDTAALAALYPSIPLRRTNRMPYADVRLAEQVRADLRAAARSEGAELEWVRDRSRVKWLLRLASDAELEDAYDPLRISERSRWIGGERDIEGIPSESLPLRPSEPGAPVRDFLTGAGEHQDIGEYEHDPAIAVLTTRADGPDDRIQAGMALQRIWLTATTLGVAVSPLTGALEHRSLRWLIRDPVAGWSEPQSILRFGYGPAVKPTPRRPISDFLLDG